MGKILFVEDDVSIRRLVKIALNSENFDVEYAENGLEGWDKIEGNKYDIILLDIMMPKLDGVSLCKRIRAGGIDSYIIMLTAMDDEESKLIGFESGADDYITKPFSPNLLVARINAGLRRVSHDQQVIQYQDIVIDPQKLTIKCNNQTSNLTVKEFELLIYLLKRRGKYISRNQLLTDLWGFSYDGDTRIIDVHISKLRQYLKLSQAAIITKRGIGYMIGEKDE